MPTKNFSINQDTLLAKSGTAVGGGNDEHLPVGIGGGYNFRAALKFNLDWAGVTSITSARLYMRTTTKVHATSWGASPTLIVERLTEANWSENDGRSSYDSPAGSGWTATGTDYDSPNVQPGVNDTNWGVGNNESTWYSVDITAIVKAWAPTSIPGGGGASNTGILVRPSANATSETVEFYSRKSSYDPYIVLTYVSNIAPTTTVTAPVNGAKLLSTDLTPAINCAFVEANAVATYEVQVATDAAFTALVWNLAATTVGLTGLTATIPYAGTALVPGTVYYVRARATDDEGAVGAYSPTITFRLNQPPTSSGSYGSAFVARVHNLADTAGWTLGGSWAKPEFKFTPTDLDGDPIVSYEVRISLAGSPVDTDTVVATNPSGTQITYLHTYALVNGTLYTVAFRSKDAQEWGPWSAEVNFRVRWGEAIYEAPTPGGSANWRITFGTLAGSGAAMATAYRKATGAGGTGTVTAWSANIPSPAAGFINVRVRVSSSGSAPTQPQLPDMTFTYDQSGALPTGWTFNDTTRAGLDTNVRRYGQNSIRIEANTIAIAGVAAIQDIDVSEDTDYTISVWVRAEALLVGCRAVLALHTLDWSHVLAEADLAPSQMDGKWHRLIAYYHTQPGETRVKFNVQVYSDSVGATGLCWFDAAMLDEGNIAGQWTPALVGLPVVIDAQGIIINSAAGGMLRIDGTVIKPAPYVGVDAPPGPTDGQLWWDTDDASTGVGGGLPVIRRVYAAGATWTKPAGLRYIEVEVVGGGGAGGGNAATAAGQAGAPGGGGGGGYAKKLFLPSDLAALTSATVVVGAGGTGVSAGTGNTGATSSFSGTGITSVQAAGGVGGNPSTAVTAGIWQGGVGGAATGGDINVQGEGGWFGTVTGGTRTAHGHGGSSVLGKGSPTAGGPGQAYGAGGAGPFVGQSVGAGVGGAGADGVVIVTEYY